jgi:hypothetical protein
MITDICCALFLGACLVALSAGILAAGFMIGGLLMWCYQNYQHDFSYGVFIAWLIASFSIYIKFAGK